LEKISIVSTNVFLCIFHKVSTAHAVTQQEEQNATQIEEVLIKSKETLQTLAQEQQQNLSKVIEQKFAFNFSMGNGPPVTISNVTVVYESPKTVILDATEFNTNPLWQAIDIAKDRGYIMDQVMTYLGSQDVSHWLIFMSR